MMKSLKYVLAVGLLMLATAPYASAEDVVAQCTTNELDLMCEEGETLQGISSTGQKKCVVASASGGGGDLYQCPQTSLDDATYVGCVGQVSAESTCENKKVINGFGKIGKLTTETLTCELISTGGGTLSGLHQCPRYTLNQAKSEFGASFVSIQDIHCVGQVSTESDCNIFTTARGGHEDMVTVECEPL